MQITKEQALELADKYLLYTGNIVLRNNITVSGSAEGWSIVAETTPVILGMQTEIITFSIDVNTGEVGVSVTMVLREIDERNGIDKPKKEEMKAKVTEVAELKKEPIDKKKINGLKKWFEDNASWLKDVISILSTIISKLSK
jgi:hypothetical protein